MAGKDAIRFMNSLLELLDGMLYMALREVGGKLLNARELALDEDIDEDIWIEVGILMTERKGNV